jgi:hypothetical protein
MKNRWSDPYAQVAAMRLRFPQFRVKQKGIFDIQFIGTLHVKQEFPLYKVMVHYRGDVRPIVKILNPEVVDNRPHWHPDVDEPCLYKPANYIWNKRRLIANDIVPWLAGWIYFYEVWLRRGKWLGPEAEHDKPVNNVA